jgi:pimeloyl-ACP methyl ester carboxylesterase
MVAFWWKRSSLGPVSCDAMDGRLIDGVAVREWGDPAEPGILLWPGLGSTGAYFSAVGAFLPGRVVAVDPPGFGSSPPPGAYSYKQLVERSSVAIGECDCRAMLGHSLGADIALGVAADPPVGLRAVVLVDGGYMDAATRAALGLPTAASRGELIAWLLENSPRFADWDEAVHGFAEMLGAEPSAVIEAYVREVLTEVDGEICAATPPERVADLLSAVVHQDFAALARSVAVPTLLVACGQPAESRVHKEPAWQAFANASSLIELHVASDWGHNPLLQDPQAAASVISNCLRAHL